MSERPPPTPGISGAGVTGSCPTEAELAAFTEGGLGGGRRTEVALHAIRCSECTAVIATVARHREKIERERPAFPQRWAALAAGVLLTAALGWAGLAWWRSQDPGTPSDAPPGIAALVEATGARRLVAARLSGGFAWAPAEVTRGEASAEDRWEIAGVAARIRGEANSDAHALGVAHLLLGNAEEAIERLEVAAEDHPENPAVLADLAAALIERGKQPERAQDLVRALDCAERALTIAPDSPEARFNKALAVEELGLREAAISAWEEYLKVDADSAWAEEARERAERLRNVPRSGTWDHDAFQRACASGDADVEALVRAHTQQAVDVLTWVFLPRWAEHALAGDADEALATLRSLEHGSQAVFRVTGDRLLARAGDEIRRRAGRVDELQLARACLRLARGRRSLDELDADAAHTILAEAARSLAALGSALWDVAELSRLSSAHYLGMSIDAEAEALRSGAAKREHGIVAMKVRWLQGLALGARGRWSEALPLLQHAAGGLEDAGFSGDAAFVRSIEASTWTNLGRTARGWSTFSSIFRQLDRVPDPRRAQAALAASAAEAQIGGLALAAVALQEASLAFAARHDSVVDLCDGWVWLAASAARAENRLLADKALAEADQALTRLPDGALRERLAAEISLVRAGVLVRDEPRRAAEAADRAVGFFERSRATARLVEAQLARARAKQAQNDPAEARRAYLAALQAVEDQRTSIEDPGVRVSFFDTAVDLARELVVFEWSRGRPQEALQFADRIRARTLLEARGRGEAAPVSVAALRQALEPAEAVLFYASLPDRTLVWVVRRAQLQWAELDLAEHELRRHVSAWRNAIERGDREETREGGKRLFAELIRPVELSLVGAGTVVVVPDGALHRIPWASLREPGSGRLWIDRVAVAVAPCLTAVEHVDLATPGPSLAAVVGNPAFDRALFPELPDLPDASEEAKEIAALYRGAELLVGSAATPDRVLKAAERAGVLHLAAHALEDNADPERSAFALAPGGMIEPRGVLLPLHIRGHDLGGLDLVVLAACRSGSGPLSRAEGPLSLARPFLEAGAKAVIVSLFDVPDRNTTMVSLHRFLQNGVAPMEAARQAVRECWNAESADTRMCGSLQLIMNSREG